MHAGSYGVLEQPMGPALSIVPAKQPTVRGYGFRFPCPFGKDPTKDGEYGLDHCKEYSYQRSRSLKAHFRKEHVHVNLCPVAGCHEKVMNVDRFIDHYFDVHLNPPMPAAGHATTAHSAPSHAPQPLLQTVSGPMQEADQGLSRVEQHRRGPDPGPAPSLKQQLDDIVDPKLMDLWSAINTMMLSVLTKVRENSAKLDGILASYRQSAQRRRKSGLEFPVPLDIQHLKPTGPFTIDPTALDTPDYSVDRGALHAKVTKFVPKSFKSALQKTMIEIWHSCEVGSTSTRNVAKMAIERVRQNLAMDYKTLIERAEQHRITEDQVHRVLQQVLINFRSNQKKRFDASKKRKQMAVNVTNHPMQPAQAPAKRNKQAASPLIVSVAHHPTPDEHGIVIQPQMIHVPHGQHK